MRHGNLGRLVLKTVHHALQTGNFLLLRIVILHKLVIIFFFALHEIRVVARIAGSSAVLNLIDHIHYIIQKHPVMGYDNYSLWIIFQIPFQPLDGGNIQVVRRLVKKQNIRLAQEQFDKRNLCLLSPGKLRKRFLSLFLGKPEFADDHIILFFKIVAAIIPESLLHCGILCNCLLRVIMFQLCRHFLKLLFPLFHRCKNLTDFLLKGHRGIFKGNLL